MLSFPKATRFQIVDECRALLHRLQPLVRDIADRVAAGGDFKGTILALAKERPDLREYFFIDERNIEDTFGLKEKHFLLRENPRFTGLFVTQGNSSFRMDLPSSPAKLRALKEF